MAFKGFNSILFDFDSIVDYQLTVLMWMSKWFKHDTLKEQSGFDIDAFMDKSIAQLKFEHCNGATDLFHTYIDSDEHISEIEEMALTHKELVLTQAIFTDTSDLIKAYRKAGSGTVKTAIRCSDDIEMSVIMNHYPFTTTIECDMRKEIDMQKYGRFIIGNYTDAFQYRLTEPKSIGVLNFRENFRDDDITLFRPELVIRLGDINSIEVVSAYRENEDPPKG